MISCLEFGYKCTRDRRWFQSCTGRKRVCVYLLGWEVGVTDGSMDCDTHKLQKITDRIPKSDTDYQVYYPTTKGHFSLPFLGTYEVVQFFDLGYLKGTHSGGWYTAPYPFHSILGWKPHTISFSFQYHLTSYHTIGMIEAFHIPGQAIPSYQSCHWVSGVLFTKYESYFCRLQYLFIGLHLLWTGSSGFCWNFKL